MNASVDGYVAAPDGDLGWSVPSDEAFQWWSDRVDSTGLTLYGRRLWEAMNAHWPTADRRPGATPAHVAYARRWRDIPKVVFSSTLDAVEGNARLGGGRFAIVDIMSIIGTIWHHLEPCLSVARRPTYRRSTKSFLYLTGSEHGRRGS